MNDADDSGEDFFDESEEWDTERDCTHCGGSGDCDEGSDPLGNCPEGPEDPHRCHACGGSGDRKDQRIF